MIPHLLNELNRVISTLAKQGQGDIESEFNNNVEDDIARQRHTVEIERNFEGDPCVLYFKNNNGHERKWGNAPRFCREQLPIAGHSATIRPDAYSGSDYWEEYFSHFQDCAELGRWSMEDRVLTLAASLKGPARTFYISFPTHERRTYSILVRRLEERFGSVRQQNRWLSRFEMRKRNSGETVAAPGNDLRQMVQKAYCNINSMAQEVLALNQLYKSIPLEMKCRCVDRECKTVADAVDIIERYEALLGESSDQKKTSVRSVSYENCSENKVDMEWQNNEIAMSEMDDDKFSTDDGKMFSPNTQNGHERKWGNAPRFCSEQLPIRPDAYSGSDDWEEYFSHFQDCAELGRWSMEDRVLTLAAS
ncbi:unnamed protein product [Mytilus coruscus]|uniref:Uncharacterized protein n=1 Tax=Mytilus coruscus TaxID=42192 RepID=A0A6J8C487_MYTCO|nr:unnamed protein product [Mytilus coruscus]